MNARELYPELAAIADELRAQGGIIERACVYDANGNLVAGREPVDPPGTVWVSGESFVKMQRYATQPMPTVPKSPRK